MDNVREIMNTEVYNIEDDLNSMITLLTLNNKSFNKCSIKFSISVKCSTLYKCSLHSYTITCNIFYDIKFKSKYAVIMKLKHGKLSIKQYSLQDKKKYDEFLMILMNEFDSYGGYVK